MSQKQVNRLKKMEQRVKHPPLTRTILAAYMGYDVEMEGHDSIRAKLHIRPEEGVQDLVCYCLKRDEPPRLKMPHVWEYTIYKPDENGVENSGTPTEQLALPASTPELALES